MNTIGTRDRRVGIKLAAALCVVLAVPFSFHGLAIIPTLALIALDVVLVAATQSLAFARTSSLDERQNAFRDAAYRRAFRFLGAALVMLLAGGLPQMFSGLPYIASGAFTGITGPQLVVLLELLVMTPTLVIAWSLPEPIDDDHHGLAGAVRTRALRLATGTAAVTIAVWLLIISLLPMQTDMATKRDGFSGTPDVTCGHFDESARVGSNFGATVGMNVEVCWNGRSAYAIAGPSMPSPPPEFDPAPEGATYLWPNLSSCGGDRREDFARIVGVHCTETIDSAGTMHYAVHADVTPLPGSLGRRTVVLTLVVTRDGRVVQMQ